MTDNIKLPKPQVTIIDDKEKIQQLHEENVNKADSFVITFDDTQREYILEKSAFKQLNYDNIDYNESKQLKEDIYNTSFLNTPYPASFLVYLTRSNWVFSACAERIAADIIRNGYDIVTKDGYDEEDDNTLAKQEILEWFENMPYAITDVIKDTEYCLDTCGKAGIEIIRENGIDTPIQYLTNFNVENIQIASDEKRILQTINGVDCWFKIYNPLFEDSTELYLNKNTGKWSETPLPVEEQANEVMWFYRKDLGCNLHGIPRIIKGTRIIEMDQGREEFNIDFFVNFGMPAWIVSITGNFYDEEGRKYLEDGTLNPAYHEERTIKYKIAEQIKQIIEGGRHGAIVMSYPTAVGQEPVKVTITPLATDVKEASFREMRKDNKDDIASIMGISSNLIGPSETGAMGNNALESELIQHNDNRIKPAQVVFNNALSKLIYFERNTTFNADVTGYKFKLLDFIEQNLDSIIERDLKLIEAGVMTRLEFQIKHSKTLGINVAEDNKYMHEYMINGRPEDAVFNVFNDSITNPYNLSWDSFKSVEQELLNGGNYFANKRNSIFNSIQTSEARRAANIQKIKQRYRK